MNNYKHILVFGLLILVGLALANFQHLHYVSIGILILFVFNLTVRKMFSFKSYFMSSFNIFASKFHYESEMDITKDLLFPKVTEGLENSKLTVQYADETEGEILATSTMTFKSWGENVYVSIREKNGSCKINLCSVGFFQMYTWGKNQANEEKFIAEFEKSFTI